MRKKVACGGETIVSPQASTGMVPLTANQRKTLESQAPIFQVWLANVPPLLILKTAQNTTDQFLLLRDVSCK
ncbi:hypothetical protein J2776_002920 [Paraburkholderia caledonica]|uniref:Uncharacterized protein n=1 Tax=Paraburkholderia caledonica TaxID=134536 RepID=A0ABU1KZ20_9BURK|nr:hypothetical protein [Paraburkholderia caledonica]